VYLTRTQSRRKHKDYQCVLLRESYRENGAVKNRTIANLSHCTPEEIEAIEFALKNKGNLDKLRAGVGPVTIQEGLSVGALWTVLEVARRVGVERALGNDRQGKLALWQVLARVLDQGSRLSAVRLAQTHAACDALAFDQGFIEDDLYDNLSWLEASQASIEDRLFRDRWSDGATDLFFYDVTSSYLEGTDNALADWGYNRDKKKGKKQVVVGLLCDAEGAPVSIEVFRGNTTDVQTFDSQVKKAAERFKCMRVTFVGDRGMIKKKGQEALRREQMHYITALTKPQIENLIGNGVFQLEMFDETVCVVEGDGVRYVLRRNPCRAEELAASRADKRKAVETAVAKTNADLEQRKKAKVETALKRVAEKIERLQVGKWLSVKADGRRLVIAVDEEALARAARLDGCYVIVSDLPADALSGEAVHDRYKDLALVEWGFRTCKTAHLEMRPIYVRTEAHTRGHVLVVMLAYLVVRELARAWAALDVTVEEGLARLSTLCSTTIRVGGSKVETHTIPVAREDSRRLLEAAGVRLPEALPSRGLRVVTRRRLPSRRKNQ
jgi:hypothetical protein